MNEIKDLKTKDLKTKEVELSDELCCEELDDEQLESVVGGALKFDPTKLKIYGL